MPVIWLVALGQLALQLATTGRYGYFGDELYYLACADHLDWGYVDHPPLSIALLAGWRALLGDSLFALRVPRARAPSTCWDASAACRPRSAATTATGSGGRGTRRAKF